MTANSMSSIPVLMYHEINEPAEAWSHLAVSPAAFKAQLAFLEGAGYTALTAGAFAELVSKGERARPRTVVITFDDGFEDFHKYAVPALVEHGFTGTVFVTTGWIQDAGMDAAANRPGHMLSWSQIAEVVDAGMEVGAHSVRHPQLDQIPAPTLREELYSSKAELEDRLGVPVPGLAYPFGYSSLAVREMARAVNYGYGYAVRNAIANEASELFRLPRLTIHNSTDLAEFRRLIDGQLSLTVVRDRALTAGWSAVRRSRARFNGAARREK